MLFRKLINLNYVHFYNQKLFYLKGENKMVNYTLSLKENKILGDNFGNVE